LKLKHISYFIGLLITFLAPGCNTDDLDINKFGTYYECTINGLVTDSDGRAVEGAEITFQDQTTYSDSQGAYSFPNALVNTKHNFIRIERNGFFTTGRTFFTDRKKTITIKNTLFNKFFRDVFKAEDGGILKDWTYEVVFPKDAIIVESTGELFKGIVQVASAYIVPTEEMSSIDLMPGDNSGIDTEDNEHFIKHYEVLFMELRSQDGIKLTMADGVKPEYRFALRYWSDKDGVPEFEFYSFDYENGLWRVAEKAFWEEYWAVGSNDYSPVVAIGIKKPLARISGKIKTDDSNPLFGGRGRFSFPDKSSNMSFIIERDGTYNTKVAKHESLLLQVALDDRGCEKKIISEQLFLPLTKDQRMDDILIANTDLHYKLVKGRAYNCYGNPLNNGYIITTLSNGNRYINKITNGDFEQKIYTCFDGLTYTINIYNHVDNKAIDALTGVLDKDVLIGDKTICSDPECYAFVQCDEIGLDVPCNDVTQSASPDHKSIQFYSYHPDRRLSMYINFFDEDPVYSYRQGTHPVFGGMISYQQNGRLFSAFVEAGTITVTINQTGGAGHSFLYGNFDLDCRISGLNKSVKFKGKYATRRFF